MHVKVIVWFKRNIFLISNYFVCCVDTDTDSVAVETEDDSSDTEYTPDEKPTTGMFDFSYSAFTCLTYCT